MARLTAEQFELASKARFGLIPRPPRAVVPSITKRDYGYVLTRWANFSAWRAWRDVGGPRPAGVWRVVPKWDDPEFTPWTLLKLIRTKWPLANTHPPDPPHPTDPAFSLAYGQSWFVIAQDYRDAAVGPDYFGRAFVADHSYEHPTVGEVAAYKQRGIRTAVWGDSEPEGVPGTSPARIVEVANELRVDRLMFQAELPRQYAAAAKKIDEVGGDGHLLIVNLSSIESDPTLYDDLESRIWRGNVLGLSECYKNCGWGDPNYGGLPMASTLGATYRDGDCAGCPADTYYAQGWVAAHRDSFYTAQWLADDYRAAR